MATNEETTTTHLDLTPHDEEEGQRLVVRLSTSAWYTERGLFQKRSLTFLRRRSVGCNFLYEDAGNGDAYDVVDRILNLDQAQDGLYEVRICNVATDWETGYVDDYDYKLVPLAQGDDACRG